VYVQCINIIALVCTKYEHKCTSMYTVCTMYEHNLSCMYKV
jgi:hypothetical protein